jgi:tetratricopeptide (TPR) repeat protein
MRITLTILGLAAVAAFMLARWGPQKHYRLAERYYQAGDYEKAQLQCQKALHRNPRYGPAQDLFRETQFLLGQGAAVPPYDRFTHPQVVRTQQLLIEVDCAVARAERHRIAGDRDAARAELRKVLEFLKWMPAGCEVDSRRQDAQFLLDLVTRDGSARD